MNKLYRSQTDCKLAGVFGGLGEVYGIDANLLRILAVLLLFLSGFFPLFITYIVAWIILPEGKPEEKERKQEKSTTTSAKKTTAKKK
jgi:phage shock protein C